jgi:hypothetical protein
LTGVLVPAQQESRVHDPAARHGEIRFHPVKFPVSICQQALIATKDGLFIQQPGLPDPLIHAGDHIPLSECRADLSTMPASHATGLKRKRPK